MYKCKRILPESRARRVHPMLGRRSIKKSNREYFHTTSTMYISHAYLFSASPHSRSLQLCFRACVRTLYTRRYRPFIGRLAYRRLQIPETFGGSVSFGSMPSEFFIHILEMRVCAVRVRCACRSNSSLHDLATLTIRRPYNLCTCASYDSKPLTDETVGGFIFTPSD